MRHSKLKLPCPPIFVLIGLVSMTSGTRADDPQTEVAPLSDVIVPIVIAHRGASGYLPEHTLPAKAMAHAQGTDYLEQDLVLTKDHVPIVLHDIHLETVSDVAALFPDRAREDGRFYAIDFTLEEIRQLTVSERFNPRTGQAVFENRFPAHQGSFHIPTLEEELTLIQGLNKSTGRVVGIYPEIKQPRFHRTADADISPIVLEVLSRFGYENRTARCYLQCFDHVELRRIREELGCQLPLVQLLEAKECHTALADTEALTNFLFDIAEYANGIGPSLDAVFQNGKPTALVKAAQAAGLVVHPWTYRADSLPTSFDTFEALHRASQTAGVDGIFSDFPDQSRALLQREQKLTR